MKPCRGCVERRTPGGAVGRIMNARTIYGEPVQGRVLWLGRRGWGPTPGERVALLVDVRRGSWPQVWRCDPYSLRTPPHYRISIRVDP